MFFPPYLKLKLKGLQGAALICKWVDFSKRTHPSSFLYTGTCTLYVRVYTH